MDTTKRTPQTVVEVRCDRCRSSGGGRTPPIFGQVRTEDDGYLKFYELLVMPTWHGSEGTKARHPTSAKSESRKDFSGWRRDRSGQLVQRRRELAFRNVTTRSFSRECRGWCRREPAGIRLRKIIDEARFALDHDQNVIYV